VALGANKQVSADHAETDLLAPQTQEAGQIRTGLSVESLPESGDHAAYQEQAWQDVHGGRISPGAAGRACDHAPDR